MLGWTNSSYIAEYRGIVFAPVVFSHGSMLLFLLYMREISEMDDKLSKELYLFVIVIFYMNVALEKLLHPTLDTANATRTTILSLFHCNSIRSCRFFKNNWWCIVGYCSNYLAIYQKITIIFLSESMTCILTCEPHTNV